MDRGAWRATVHALTQCRTWLKQLSMHAHTHSNVVSRWQLWWHISSTCFIPIVPIWITRLFCESFILIYLSVSNLKIHESIDKRCSLILVLFSVCHWCSTHWATELLKFVLKLIWSKNIVMQDSISSDTEITEMIPEWLWQAYMGGQGRWLRNDEWLWVQGKEK